MTDRSVSDRTSNMRPLVRVRERNRVISQGRWEEKKDLIKNLYIDKDYDLKHLAEVLKSEHGFHASTKQYKSQFKRWDFRKNLNRVHALYGLREYVEADKQGRKVKVKVGGKHRPRADLRLYLQNHNETDDQLLKELENNHQVPPNIEVEELRAPSSLRRSITDGTLPSVAASGHESDSETHFHPSDLYLPAPYDYTTHTGDVPCINDVRDVQGSLYHQYQPPMQFSNILQPAIISSGDTQALWRPDSIPDYQTKFDYFIMPETLPDASNIDQTMFNFVEDPQLMRAAVPHRDQEHLFYLMSETPVEVDLRDTMPDLTTADLHDKTYRIFLRWTVYACIYRGQELHEQSERAIQTAVDNWFLSFDVDRDNTISTLGNMLHIFNSFGHKALAIEIIDRIYTIGKGNGVFLPNIPVAPMLEFLLSTNRQLLETSTGHNVRRPYDLEKLDLICKAFDQNNRFVRLSLTARYNLAWAQLQNGRNLEGMAGPSLVRTALHSLQCLTGEMREIFGETHIQTISAIATLARAYIRNGQIKEGRSLLEVVMDTLERSRPVDHPHTLESKSRYSRVLFNLADNETNTVRRREYLERARSLSESVLVSRIRYLGYSNIKTQYTLKHLRKISAAQAYHSEALQPSKNYGMHNQHAQYSTHAQEIDDWT